MSRDDKQPVQVMTPARPKTAKRSDAVDAGSPKPFAVHWPGGGAHQKPLAAGQMLPSLWRAEAATQPAASLLKAGSSISTVPDTETVPPAVSDSAQPAPDVNLGANTENAMSAAEPLPAGTELTSGGANPADSPAATQASVPNAPSSAVKTESGKREAPYPATAKLPTQLAAEGIRFDFNMGARLLLPEGSWDVKLRDLDTGNILFQTTTRNALIHSTKRYFVRFAIDVSSNGRDVLHHVYDCRDKPVLIQFPIGTLGDMIAWFPYAVRFQEQHGCKLTVALSDKIIPLFNRAYPHIRFATHDQVEDEKLNEEFYATYSMGLFFDDKENVWQPTDFRHVGLHRTAGYILGVDPTEAKPRIALEDETRPMEAPYVVIAAQSSSQCKYWNNPHGWREIVTYLNKAGYQVVCIDQRPTHGTGLVWNHIPHGVVDETGDKPLTERARWLRHAAFFIGLSSGLSWLAWASGTPVVLISGFTHPTNEFETPYRVINYHACNSCWNDVRHRFDHHDFLWCPRHANTDRQFECTKLITPEQVKKAIRSIPGFVEPAEPTPA